MGTTLLDRPQFANSGPLETPRERHAPILDDLKTAIDVLASIEAGQLTTEESLAVARTVEQVSRASEAALLRCIRSWGDRTDMVRSPETTEEELKWRASDGARRLLLHDLGRTWSDAGRLLATEKALRKDAETVEVLRSGIISVPQARIIADTLGLLDKQPGSDLTTARQDLIKHARTGSTENLRSRAADIAHRKAPTQVLTVARINDGKARLTMTRVAGGFVPGGFLPASGAEAVLTVLDAMAATPARPEENGEAHARAEALIRLAEDRLRTGELPHRHGGTASVTIIMRSDTALGIPDSPPAATGYGQALPAAEAQLFTCEAAIRAVLVDGDGEILWQGRKKRLATRAQYEALAIRDRGCTAPACSRPAHECDAHHDVPWSEGGTTDVARMRLLCRRHHREIHDELWLRQYGRQEAEAKARDAGRTDARARKPWYTEVDVDARG